MIEMVAAQRKAFIGLTRKWNDESLLEQVPGTGTLLVKRVRDGAVWLITTSGHTTRVVQA